MLPKNRRIERKEFGQIMSRGNRYNSPSFTLYLSKMPPGKDISKSKFSFSVSKKVSGLAVNRNKLRRRGYSIILGVIDKVRPGYYLFFLYKKDYEKDYGLLSGEIERLLSSALVIV